MCGLTYNVTPDTILYYTTTETRDGIADMAAAVVNLDNGNDRMCRLLGCLER
jgi:hypothetical protein